MVPTESNNDSGATSTDRPGTKEPIDSLSACSSGVGSFCSSKPNAALLLARASVAGIVCISKSSLVSPAWIFHLPTSFSLESSLAAFSAICIPPDNISFPRSLAFWRASCCMPTDQTSLRQSSNCCLKAWYFSQSL